MDNMNIATRYNTPSAANPRPPDSGIQERALNNLQAIHRALDCARNLRRRVIAPEAAAELQKSPGAPDHIVFIQEEQAHSLQALNSILDEIERAL